MKKFAIEIISIGILSTNAFSSDLTSERAVAYGSLMMVNEFGYDQSSWKAIETFSWCQNQDTPLPNPRPIPTDKLPDNQQPDTSTSNSQCSYDVIYVTDYTLVTCPNGSAHINRSGHGIFLENSTTGIDYVWAELSTCGWGDGQGSPSQKPEDPIESLSREAKLRPLHWKNIRKLD